MLECKVKLGLLQFLLETLVIICYYIIWNMLMQINNTNGKETPKDIALISWLKSLDKYLFAENQLQIFGGRSLLYVFLFLLYISILILHNFKFLWWFSLYVQNCFKVKFLLQSNLS